LDIRTKHIIAQDRLVVAEQRILDAERRKSATNLQLLAFEQKQLEKRLALIYKNFNSTPSQRPLQMRGRSTSEVIFRNMRRTSSWTDPLPMLRPKLSVSFHDSKPNLLSLPTTNDYQRRFSAFSDGDTPFFTSDMSSGEEGEYSKSSPKITHSRKMSTRRKTLPKLGKQTKPLLPIVAIIPPD
jgi:hypothetical protein